MVEGNDWDQREEVGMAPLQKTLDAEWSRMRQQQLASTQNQHGNVALGAAFIFTSSSADLTLSGFTRRTITTFKMAQRSSHVMRIDQLQHQGATNHDEEGPLHRKTL